MLRITRVLLIVALLAMLVAAVLPAAAQTTEGVCSSKPVAQVRFYDFPDIPIYSAEADADLATEIFSGAVEASSIPTPQARVKGGSRQKYLLCGHFAEGDGSVQIVANGRLFWAPEWLIESIVPRNWRDSQAGSPGEW